MSVPRLQNLAGALLVVMAWVFAGAHVGATQNRPLNWDEADYLNAARLGLLANALERGSPNLLQFYELGLAKWRGLDPPADLAPEGSDPFLLRHFHPPGPVYVWAAAPNEQAGRALNVALLVALALTFVWAARPSRGEVALGTWSVLPVLLTTLPIIECFERMTFHTFHAVGACVFAGTLRRFVTSPTKKRSVLLGLAAALMFITLETAWFVFVGATLALFICMPARRAPKHLVLTMSSCIASVLVLWPGAIWTGSPAKTWLMHLYRIVRAGNEEYRDVESFNVAAHLMGHLPLILVVVLGLAACLWLVRRGVGQSSLAMWISALVLLAMIWPFALRPDYLLPAVVMMTAAAATSISNALPLLGLSDRRVTMAVLVVPLVSFTMASWQSDLRGKRSSAHLEREQWMEDVHSISQMAKDHPVLVDGAHRVAFYLDDEQVALDALHYSSRGFPLVERVDYAYAGIEERLAGAGAPVVFVQKERHWLQKAQTELSALGYVESSLNEFRVFTRKRSRGHEANAGARESDQ